LAANFRQRRTIARYHWNSRRHRFQCRHPEAFIERGKREYTGARIKGAEFRIADVSGYQDPVEARAVGYFAERLGCLVALRSCKHQHPVRRHRTERPNQHRLILASLNCPHTKYDLLARYIREHPRRDAMMHNADARGIDAEQILE